AQQQLPSPSPHLIFTGLHAQTPDPEESRSEGSTLHIQCPYDESVVNQHKAWRRWRDGQWETLVQTTYSAQPPYTEGTTQEKFTIRDNHRLRTMSISMRNLQVEDSGTYSCGYYFGTYGYALLKRISLNVFKELYRSELDSLSVQCPYSPETHNTDIKVWCRTEREGLCIPLARTDTPSTRGNNQAWDNRASIQDDTRKRTVTVTMEKLQDRDTGVYWCALLRRSDVIRIMEVRLTVSKSEYRLAAKGADGRCQPHLPCFLSSNVDTFILLSVILSILFILAVISLIILCVRQCKHLKRKGTGQAENTYDKPEDIAQLDSTERTESLKDDSKDLKYVTLNFQSRLNPEDPLYCNVESSQTHRKPSDEHVEYATIALK
ncbi:CLM7 protein, partial [Podargus strigoides]|nr:CLM7 protein [Podargus strigoides]